MLYNRALYTLLCNCYTRYTGDLVTAAPNRHRSAYPVEETGLALLTPAWEFIVFCAIVSPGVCPVKRRKADLERVEQGLEQRLGWESGEETSHTMAHEPSRLVGDIKLSVKLMGANTLFRGTL